MPAQAKKVRATDASDALQRERLLGFLFARLANEQDAQELAQEAYLRLIRASESRLINDPAAYLFRIARNLLYEWYTSPRPPNEPLQEETLVSEQTSVEDSVALTQQVERLEVLLEQLSPKCRAAVVMHRRDGMTYNEIGNALGVSASMVKKYLSQGLARCRAGMRRFKDDQ